MQYSFCEKLGAFFIVCVLPWLLLGLEVILE